MARRFRAKSVDLLRTGLLVSSLAAGTGTGTGNPVLAVLGVDGTVVVRK